jgi:hypothetical protein
MSLADMIFGDVTGLRLIGDVIGCNTFFRFGDVIGVEQVWWLFINLQSNKVIVLGQISPKNSYTNYHSTGELVFHTLEIPYICMPKMKLPATQNSCLKNSKSILQRNVGIGMWYFWLLKFVYQKWFCQLLIIAVWKIIIQILQAS